LILQLSSSTQAGKLSWETTADEKTFRLTLDVGIMHIRLVTPPKRSRAGAIHITPGGNVAPLPSEAPDYHEFVMLNQDNAVVEAFRGQTPRDFTILGDLYEAARQSALKPDEFLRLVEQEVIRRTG